VAVKTSEWPRCGSAGAGLGACLLAGALLAAACRAGDAPRAGADAAASAAVVGPRIAFGTMVHDFGQVIAGQTATHLFSFKNTGDQTLVIQNVTTSCGCTAAVMKSREIAPGASGEIEVRFSANSAGPFRKSIAVSSNDPRQPGTTLMVSATVTPDLDYEPHYIKLVTDDPNYRTVRIRFVGSLAELVHPAVAEIRGDPAAAKHVAVRPIEERKDGKRTPGLELKLKDQNAGSGSADLVVTTGLGEPARLGIPFSWGESVKLRNPS
jgi:hypothetical protein